jgi:site-specific recombinase XerD
LTLDDIHWQSEEIQIVQRKTGYPLILPLTDAVGTVLLHYLRHGRPHSRYRQLFLSSKAPVGPLGYTAVSDAFSARANSSGLNIPFRGSHCLRHAFAIHLLRQGTSLKTLGDLLGHRTADSTCVYLRLAIDDLREVSLAVPQAVPQSNTQEERP